MVDWGAADKDRCYHTPQHAQWVTKNLTPIFICRMATTHISNAIEALRSGRDTDISEDRRDWWIKQMSEELQQRRN